MRATENLSFRTECSHCGQHIEVPPEMVEQQADCPTCGSRLRFPQKPPPIPTLIESLNALQEHARKGVLTDESLDTYTPKTIESALYAIDLTTESVVLSHRITERLGIVTYEAAFGMGPIADFLTGVSDLFGGRSKTTQKTLRNARNVVLRGLRREALLLGADAVVAIDLDYSEFSGKGKSMLFLVGSGTAVRWEPIELRPPCIR